MALVDYPKLSLTQESNAADYIVALYRELGWDQKSELDPKKIVMNPEHWKDVVGELGRTAEGRSASFLWLNSGPGADEKVPYGKITIEDGAFNRGDPGLSGADKAAIDEAVASSFVVEGNVVHLEADRGETNEFLLQEAYDARNLTPQAFLESMHDRVLKVWTEGIDFAVDEALERAGIVYTDGRYDAARDYLTDHYTFEPPYSHYLDQSMKVNIMLGTAEEKDADFASIRAMCDELNGSEPLSSEELDNGLMWLVEQQGYSVDELKYALSNYEKWGFDAAEVTSGTFLASVSEEMQNFPNVMGSVTLLAEMSLHDMAKMLDPSTQLVMPKDTVIGIFAPWVGGGSALDIQLEKDLVIPSELRFDFTIEGASCGQYTVNEVYGLIDEAWRKPLDITDPIRGYDERATSESLSSAMKEARDRASQKNLAYLEAPKERKPEMGL